MNLPYTTEEDVRQELQNSDGDISAIITAAIDLASRYIDEKTSREFRIFDYTETPLIVRPENILDGGNKTRGPVLVSETNVSNGREVFLGIPIVELGSLVYAGVEIPMGDYFYQVGDRGVTLRHPISVDLFDRKLEFFGLLGWEPVGWPDSVDDSLPPLRLPSGVRRAATLIAAAWTGEMRQEQVGLDGGRVEVLDRRIPTEAKDLIKHWSKIICL